MLKGKGIATDFKEPYANSAAIRIDYEHPNYFTYPDADIYDGNNLMINKQYYNPIPPAAAVAVPAGPGPLSGIEAVYREFL